MRPNHYLTTLLSKTSSNGESETKLDSNSMEANKELMLNDGTTPVERNFYNCPKILDDYQQTDTLSNKVNAISAMKLPRARANSTMEKRISLNRIPHKVDKTMQRHFTKIPLKHSQLLR